MKDSYWETRLDQAAAISAELLVFIFFAEWFYILLLLTPVPGFIAKPYYEFIPFIASIILSILQFCLIISRKRIALLFTAFLLALPPFIFAIIHPEGSFAGLLNSIRMQLYYGGWIVRTGIFLEMLFIAVLIFRRLRFTWLQKRAEKIS